jgi:hypothetical protein
VSSLPMPSPLKHPKTGVYWLRVRVRVRVPRDLRAAVGKGEVKRSLRTKDPAEAKARFPAALDNLQREWRRLRTAPAPLTPRQIVGLAGEWYRDLDARGGQAFDGGVWSVVEELRERLSARPDALERWYGPDADRLLASAGLRADAESRRLLLEELHRQAAALNLRRAAGDFSPDPHAGRFPPPPSPPLALSHLLDLWEKDHAARGGAKRAAAEWRRVITGFIKHLGRDDAKAVTPKDVSTYADHLRHERSLSAKSINDTYLAAIGAVYRMGIAKHLLDANPAQHVKVSAERPNRWSTGRLQSSSDPFISNADQHVRPRSILSGSTINNG